jgi:hypothetical protein
MARRERVVTESSAYGAPALITTPLPEYRGACLGLPGGGAQ